MCYLKTPLFLLISSRECTPCQERVDEIKRWRGQWGERRRETEWQRDLPPPCVKCQCQPCSCLWLLASSQPERRGGGEQGNVSDDRCEQCQFTTIRLIILPVSLQADGDVQTHRRPRHPHCPLPRFLSPPPPPLSSTQLLISLPTVPVQSTDHMHPLGNSIERWEIRNRLFTRSNDIAKAGEESCSTWPWAVF